MSREKLASLEQLQSMDLELDVLRKEADVLPAKIAELDALVTRARVAADLERGKLADNERARRSQQNVLDGEKDKVKKWEARLPQLKHPREFAALQREVENAKKQNAAAEEEIKLLDAQAVELKASLRVKEAELAQRQAELDKVAGHLRTEEATLRAQLAELEQKREAHKAKVDPKLLSSYEMIRKRRPGRALVHVRDGSCMACHRRLLPQLANRLLVGGTVESCPSCQRLLYSPPGPEETATT